MSSTLWLLALALLASRVHTSSTSQCSSLKTCYKGGATSTPCTISTGACPPCITFSDDGCYVKVDGACPFGVDCSSAFSSSGSDATHDGSTTSSRADVTSSPADVTSSVSSHGNDTAGQAPNSSDSTGSGSTSTSNSDMSVVFAIIGAAIGVIAVAVIFLTLVRRSKAAREDDDDEVQPSPAYVKNPVTRASSNVAGSNTYASYGGATTTTSGTNDVKDAVKYYSQQPQMATAPSPRVAGRAIPSQPVGATPGARAGVIVGGSTHPPIQSPHTRESYEF